MKNNEENRRWVIDMIQRRLNHWVIVKCDEENNPVDIMDRNLLIAELIWDDSFGGIKPKIGKTVLVFGKESDVEEYKTKINLILDGI